LVNVTEDIKYGRNSKDMVGAIYNTKIMPQQVA